MKLNKIICHWAVGSLLKSRIEPATFRFVSQPINHCATAVPQNIIKKIYFQTYFNILQYITNTLQVTQFIYIWKLIYMFRVVRVPALPRLRKVAVKVWQVPDAVDTVVCAPADGWNYHTKHVEQFTDIIKLCNVASCWIYIGIYLRRTDPWTLDQSNLLNSIYNYSTVTGKLVITLICTAFCEYLSRCW